MDTELTTNFIKNDQVVLNLWSCTIFNFQLSGKC